MPQIQEQEKNCKEIYKSKLREQNAEKDKIADESKKAELRARMERQYKKVGKTSMPRSNKIKVKKEKQKVVVDQATLDQKTYLGDIEP